MPLLNVSLIRTIALYAWNSSQRGIEIMIPSTDINNN